MSKIMENSVTESSPIGLFKIDKHFCLEDNKINVVQFLKAANNLIAIVDRFGKLLAPVKYDIQGNINKIKNVYKYNEESCLLELMLEESKQPSPKAAEGVLWLNRSMLMFELVFQEILNNLKAKKYDTDMKTIFTIAYEGSVKKYHNWVAQQLFHLICKMFSSLPEFLKQMKIDNIEEFELVLSKYNKDLCFVRSKIDSFFIENNLFV